MKKILLLGETCIDIYAYGQCSRLNPEAPTPILSYEDYKENLGMSGNVKANLGSLYGQLLAIDHVTNDEQILKIRFVDKKHGYILLRVDKDVKLQSISFDTILDLSQKLENGQYDALVISDYNKGFIDAYYMSILSLSAKKGRTPSFIDTKKAYSNFFSGFDYIKINSTEYKAGWDEYNGAGKLIVTDGENGATLYYNKQVSVYPTSKKEVVDVSGAGDTFLAALVISILSGRTLNKSIEYANAAAGVAVSSSGVVAVNHIDVNEF